MIHYSIRATRETLKKTFNNHFKNACFCIDSDNMSDSGICDVIVIPGNEEVKRIIEEKFICTKIEYENTAFNEMTPPYYGYEIIGNRRLL